MTIPLLRPSCSEAEIDAVAKVLRSGWWGNGPVCQEFEGELAARTGYGHCVTVNSATAALHLALLACGIGKGDEIIVPALTFVSTALAVTYAGARPVFADVRPDTLTLDWEDVAAKTNDRTLAVIPVDYAGYPAGPKGTSLLVVEDAAHYPLGPHYGDLACCSFHPVKPLATGDGGVILTNNPHYAERLRSLRWMGINRDTWQRTGVKYSWDYDIQEVGYKAHWNDIQAAIGLVQLRRSEELTGRRHGIAQRYLAELAGLPGLQLPADHPNHAWHLFVVRVNMAQRYSLLDYLAERGISAGVHYKPLSHYQMYGYQSTPPVTGWEWRRLVSLPIYADMTDAEQEQVIAAVRSWCEKRS